MKNVKKIIAEVFLSTMVLGIGTNLCVYAMKPNQESFQTNVVDNNKIDGENGYKNSLLVNANSKIVSYQKDQSKVTNGVSNGNLESNDLSYATVVNKALKTLSEFEANKETANWEEAARIWNQVLNACEACEDNKLYNICNASLKKIYANIAWEKAKKDITIENWEKTSELCKKAAAACMEMGDAVTADAYTINAKKAHATTLCLSAVHAWNTAVMFPEGADWVNVSYLYDLAEQACKDIGYNEMTDSDKAKFYVCSAEARKAHAVVAWKEALENPVTGDWVKAASFLDEAAEFYSKLDDAMNAGMCIENANRARMEVLKRAMDSCHFNSTSVE